MIFYISCRIQLYVQLLTMGKVQSSTSFPASFLAAGAPVLQNWLGHTGLFPFLCLLHGGSNCLLAHMGAKLPLLLVFASVIIIILEGMRSWFISPLADLCVVRGLTFRHAGGSQRSGKELGPLWPPLFPQRHDWLRKQKVVHNIKFKKDLLKLILLHLTLKRWLLYFKGKSGSVCALSRHHSFLC